MYLQDMAIITEKMYLRILIICIVLSKCSVELISVRQEVRMLGERLHLLERKHVLESGQYQTQIGHVLDILHGLNSSDNTYFGGNDGETTTTGRLEQEIQAKVNTTVQAIERSVELFKHTTTKQMQAVLRGIRNEKVLRKRSAERVMDQLDNNIQKLVTKITGRLDEQDLANRELMKQVNSVIDRIDKVREFNKNLKDEITGMNDTLRYYGNHVLDNAVVLKTIEDTANASQCHPNANEETLKDIQDSLTNLIETSPLTCPPEWNLLHSTGSCYRVFPSTSFDEAVQNCADQNSHITDIRNELENDFVVSLANNEHTWIGLTDEETEGVWRWKHNDQLASYLKWQVGQPDSGTDQNCAVISWHKSEKQWWYDRPCGDSERYICKKVLR